MTPALRVHRRYPLHHCVASTLARRHYKPRDGRKLVEHDASKIERHNDRLLVDAKLLTDRGLHAIFVAAMNNPYRPSEDRR